MIPSSPLQRSVKSTFFFFSKIVFAVGLVSSLSMNFEGALAAAKAGIEFEDLIKTSGASEPNGTGAQGLVLNGLGVRTKLIFKVYVAGLYLQEKSTDAEKILASDAPKLLKLQFLRDVDAGKIREAWAEGFEKNCVSECETNRALVAQLGNLMRDMKENDTLEFSIAPSSVGVRMKGSDAGRVEGNQFGKNILAIFLGKNPPNKELKEGLLGK